MNDEMNAALDEIGVPKGDEPIVNADPIESEPIVEPEPEPEIAADPPGYISYQEWVDSGKDPDDWQGKNKYEQQYGLIQDSKEFKSELKSLKGLMQSTVDATTQLQEEKYQQGLTDAKAELAQALEDNDAEKAVAAQQKINEPPPRPTQPAVNPVHGQFFASNPVLDNTSSQFDPEFMQEFSRIYDGKLRADGVQMTDQLTERAVNGYMKTAYESTKSLFPDKFESPRNSRSSAQPKAKRSAAKTDPVDSIKGMKVQTKNPRDNNAMMDTYNMILQKGGKDEADAFAKAMGIPA